MQVAVYFVYQRLAQGLEAAVSDASPAIEVRNVTKVFGGTVAANDICLSVGRGEFFSFLGPSGCGKTTVLRMIAGFETPTSGQILIDGKDIVKMPAHKRPVNMVFQSYALFPHLTILENIGFGLQFGNMPKADITKAARRALSMVRLEQLESRYPAQLSGGQQQRIALARAIVKQPSVLLLDEPLSALDPQIREDMQSELSRLQQELGMTFIMVTHDQNEALALSHRIAVFCAGNLEQVDGPKEIYSTPKTKFVAQFIGHSNVIPCCYVGMADGMHKVRLADGTLFSALSENERSFKAGDACFISIKPQSISVRSAVNKASNAVSGDSNTLHGRLRSIAYKGMTTEFFVEVGDLLIRADVAVNEDQDIVQTGASLSLACAPAATWLLANTCSSVDESAMLGAVTV